MRRNSRQGTKVLVINDRDDSWSSYYSPFEHLGEYCGSLKILDTSPEDVVCAVFTGGQDVNPSVYGHRPSRETSFSKWRDEHEIDAFRRVRAHDIPIFGICRGAQLMCALAGGVLCQHLTHHGGCRHDIETSDGKIVEVNSLHHQMQIPPRDAEVLAWCRSNRSSIYLGDNGQEIEVKREVECVHYPTINALGVQYHPELMPEYSAGYIYYQRLIKTFMYWQSFRKNPSKIRVEKAA